MLFFTYPMDIAPEVKRLLAERLEEETGQKCRILDLNCTGVYYAPDAPKETTDCGAAHPPGQDKDVPQRDSPMTMEKDEETYFEDLIRTQLFKHTCDLSEFVLRYIGYFCAGLALLQIVTTIVLWLAIRSG